MNAVNYVAVKYVGSVGVVTLDRSQKRNALSIRMRSQLCAVLADLDQTAEVSAVVLTGADPAFCAGVDYTEAQQFDARYSNRFQLNPGIALRAMRKPVICAVNGACVSGGLELALSCSYIVASSRARLADTHARLDVLPTWGLSALLPRAVGVRMARELSITGRFVDAEEARALRLVNRVVPHDQLVPTALDMAAQIASTSAVADILSVYRSGEDLPLSAAFSAETAAAFARPLDPETFAQRGHLSGSRPPAMADRQGDGNHEQAEDA